TQSAFPPGRTWSRAAPRPRARALTVSLALIAGLGAAAAQARADEAAAPPAGSATPSAAAPASNASEASPPAGAPGYPPPPPRASPPRPYYGTYGRRPRYYGYATPIPDGVYRPFSLTFGAGAGGLFGPHEHDLAFSYNLFRLGIGLAPNFSV